MEPTLTPIGALRRAARIGPLHREIHSSDATQIIDNLKSCTQCLLGSSEDMIPIWNNDVSQSTDIESVESESMESNPSRRGSQLHEFAHASNWNAEQSLIGNVQGIVSLSPCLVENTRDQIKLSPPSIVDFSNLTKDCCNFSTSHPGTVLGLIETQVLGTVEEMCLLILKELSRLCSIKANKRVRENSISICPYGIATTVLMCLNGNPYSIDLDFEPKLKMLGKISLGQFRTAAKHLDNYLSTLDSGVTIGIHRSLWIPEAAEQCSALTDTLTSCGVQVIKIPHDVDRYEVGTWFDRIAGIPCDGAALRRYLSHQSLLASIIRIEGSWTVPFDRAHTTREKFFLPDGSHVTVDMMRTREILGCYICEHYTAVAVPYGQDSSLMATIVLPKTCPLDALLALSGHKALEPSDTKTWAELNFSLLRQQRLCQLLLPRFTIRTCSDALSILLCAGYGDLGSLFCNIPKTPSMEDVRLEYILHGVAMKVDEGADMRELKVKNRMSKPCHSSSTPSLQDNDSETRHSMDAQSRFRSAESPTQPNDELGNGSREDMLDSVRCVRNRDDDVVFVRCDQPFFFGLRKLNYGDQADLTLLLCLVDSNTFFPC